MSDGKWRGYEKPGGADFVAPTPDTAPDCPACRYGTLIEHERDSSRMVCIDCGLVFPKDRPKKLRKPL